jgi:hypothetical protein
MAEFGKRRPVVEPAAAPQPSSPGSQLQLPNIDPIQIAVGAGLAFLAFVLATMAINTLLPFKPPVFKQYVFVPAEQRKDLIKETFEVVRPPLKGVGP